MFTTDLFTRAELWNQPKFPTIEGMDNKICYLYTMEFLPAMELTCSQMEISEDNLITGSKPV